MASFIVSNFFFFFLVIAYVFIFILVHKENIIHRDIAARNILLGQNYGTPTLSHMIVIPFFDLKHLHLFLKYRGVYIRFWYG